MMRKLLGALERHTPGWVRRIELEILADTTARAFGAEGISLKRLPAGRALKAYAAFTEKCMETCEADPERIWKEAYRTGALVRKYTGFTERKDLERLVFYLYKNIGITMSGRIPGEITVSGCYFSRFYTPEQCALMSVVDSGVIAGIFGGGELVFTGRITEGCGRCTACFERGGADGK